MYFFDNAMGCSLFQYAGHNALNASEDNVSAVLYVIKVGVGSTKLGEESDF